MVRDRHGHDKRRLIWHAQLSSGSNRCCSYQTPLSIANKSQKKNKKKKQEPNSPSPRQISSRDIYYTFYRLHDAHLTSLNRCPTDETVGRLCPRFISSDISQVFYFPHHRPVIHAQRRLEQPSIYLGRGPAFSAWWFFSCRL